MNSSEQHDLSSCQQDLSILALTGDKVMRISDTGAAEITVDSGLAVYSYIIPAQSK